MQGTFWTTEDPTTRRRGDLDIEGGRIVLPDGHLVETMEVLEQTAVAISLVPRSLTNLEFTVHGDLDSGLEVTIPNVTVGSYTDHVQELRFLEVLEGTHADATLQYRSATIVFDAPHDALVAKWMLEGSLSVPKVGTVKLSRSERTIEFADLPGITQSEIERCLIQPMANLLTLLSHEVPRIKELSLVSTDTSDSSGERRHFVRRKEFAQASAETRVRPIVSLQHFGMDEIARWYEMNDALNPVCAVIGKTISSHSLPVESRVLHLAASVEAVHRVLLGTQRMTRSEAKKIRSTAVAAVPDSAKLAVRSLLADLQYPTFADRLEEMLNGIGSFASDIAGVLTNSSPDAPTGQVAWIKAVTRHRNFFAHQEPHSPSDLRTFAGEMFVLFESLGWLLTVALLTKVGIDTGKLEDELRSTSQFQLFRERSIELWPSIYRATSESPTADASQ
ncbi:MAG: hypothetical protein JWO62_1490 [Acidimicrobiaceae bacterium]|nr:hypothetical protein [Acidimicrobiaceae bacterium]